MGTTLVVCTIIGESMYVANVGDSRLYLYDEKLSQITRDHSLVEEMVALGKLNRDEARKHKRKNVITRAIGGGKEVMADFFEAELTAGNRIVMCSDGLSNMVDDGEIEQVLSSDLSIEDKTRKLIESAVVNVFVNYNSLYNKEGYENILEECREIIKKSLDKKEIIVKEYGI